MLKMKLIIVIFLFITVCAFAQPTEGDTFWTFKGGAGFSGGPALGYDGTVYAICGDGYLYAINPDGTEKWHREIMPSSNTSPSVGPDGTIYVPGMYNLFAFNPDGTEKWHFSRPGFFKGSASIGPDSSIYVYCTNGKLYCIDYNGLELWNSRHYSLKVPISSYGFIYVGVHSVDSLYRIGLDGSILMSSESPCGFNHGAIGSFGELYYCCHSIIGPLNAMDSIGTVLWTYEARLMWEHSPAIGTDGTVYMPAGDSTLKAIHPDGSEIWSCPLGILPLSLPAVGSDGVIYIGGSRLWPPGRLLAVNPEGTIRWAFNISASSVHEHENVAIGDGVLYFAPNMNLYAIKCSSSGLARSPWPKYGADNQNSGYVNH